jgi:hypothetical protein
MDWATYQAAIEAWVRGQLGSGVDVGWRDEAEGWLGKTRARLSVTGSESLGVDEVRWNLDGTRSPGDDFVPTVSGLRNFVLSVLVETRDQRPSGAARFYLEKLRTSLHKPKARAALLAAGLAFQTATTVQNVDVTLDDRVESRAILDIRFGAAVNETDTTEADSYVDKAKIAATLETPAGGDAGWPEKTFGNT